MENKNKPKVADVSLPKIIKLVPYLIFLSSCHPNSSLSDAKWLVGGLIITTVILAWKLAKDFPAK